MCEQQAEFLSVAAFLPVATLVSRMLSSVGRSTADRRTWTPHRSVDRSGIHAHDRPSRSLGKLALYSEVTLKHPPASSWITASGKQL